MQTFDLAVIGGAFSGAATALLLKRQLPGARVLIIEKSTAFDRKVGESTTEVSSCFLTKVLGLSTYLGHEQLIKQGLRMWFTKSEDQGFEECVELGAKYNSRLPGFQVDREKLDQHMLNVAENAGCEVWRPAKVMDVELGGIGKNVLKIQRGEERLEVLAKWVVDASGRVAYLGRKLGVYTPLEAHPTNALWGRFKGVKDWDGHEIQKKYPKYARACRTGRSWATNHITGLGWWVWVIPLKGGDYSVGLVYDKRLFTPPEGANIAEKLRKHFMTHPVGREILSEATPIEGDTRAYSQLPYYNTKVMGDGWAMVGDAAGFLDPFYSPGLDFCSFTAKGVEAVVAKSLQGEDVTKAIEYYAGQYQFCFHSWFNSIYRDKYYYMGDAQLMAASFLMDIALYHLGPVRQVFRDLEEDFSRFPFEGKPGRIVAAAITFYNKRLSTIAKRRIEAGCYGAKNSDWRLLVNGFVPDPIIFKTLRQGIGIWLKAEWETFFLPRKKKEQTPMPMPIETDPQRL